MSPASKSKSKDKLAAKAVKERTKASLKSTPTPANAGNGIAGSESHLNFGTTGIPGSGYNPIFGTFHTLETVPPASLPAPQNNSRFRNIDETEDHSGSSLGTTADYDSLSNNDSCSGESEDQREKTTISIAPRAESVPGSDTDKRDKIRQKNEKKHQRQKEKRAQELHERCSGYLISKKLESLAQKLEAMGFSLERATIALIHNEGRVEESVAWLLEGGEDSKQQVETNLEGAKLKIGIADELAQIAALERKYKCTKQEVERAAVACEGDLEKAEAALKAQKQEPTMVLSRSEQSGDHPVASARDSSNKLPSSVQNPAGRTPVKGVASVSIQQHLRDENTRLAQKIAAMRKTTAKQELTRPLVATPPLDKRCPVANSSPLQIAAPQAKTEARYTVGGGHEVKTSVQAGPLKEPVIMMQRPQSNLPKQTLPSTSISPNVSPPASTGQKSSILQIELMRRALDNVHLEQLRNRTFPQLLAQNRYQQFVSSRPEPAARGWSDSWITTGTPSTRTSSSLAMPSSSLGLFTGWGSSGSSLAIDWSTGGSMPRCDYTNVDWSLDSTLLTPSNLKSNQLYDNVSRPVVVNGGVYLGGFQEEGSLVADPVGSSAQEWTSPFNGRDLLRAPRQFVTSPSL